MWVLAALENVTVPGWLMPTVLTTKSTLAQLLEYVDMDYLSWLSWLFTPVVIAFLLPIIFLVLIYGCVIWLHIFKLRHKLSEAFTEGPWEFARTAIASFWDAQGWIWHGYEVTGLENLPSSGPALIVYYHGALPIDVYYLLAKCILYKSRTIRCVGDKFLFRIPGFRLLCDVFFITPGSVSSCVQELRNDNLLCISPGGVREALFSSENYEILWGKRLGFAKVALQSHVPVLPMFTENIRESFRTPGWARKAFKWLYESTRLPLVPIYGGFPVKLRTYIGAPLLYPSYELADSTVDLLHENHLLSESGSVDVPLLHNSPSTSGISSSATIVETALLGLIERHQRRPGSIVRALLDRVPAARPFLCPREDNGEEERLIQL